MINNKEFAPIILYGLDVGNAQERPILLALVAVRNIFTKK